MHRQILADFWLDDAQALRFVQPLWAVLMVAVRESGATLLAEHVHQFRPYGFTGVALLAQSHVSVHTWVEQHLLLLDVQSCGDMQPEVILERLSGYLLPQRLEVCRLERGCAELPVSGVTEAGNNVGTVVQASIDGGKGDGNRWVRREKRCDAFGSADNADEPDVGDAPAP